MQDKCKCCQDIFKEIYEIYIYIYIYILKIHLIKHILGDFLGGPVVKNLPSNAGDMGLIPSLGTKIPPAMGQPSLCATTRENCEPNKQSPVLKVDTIQPNK